MIMLAVGWLLSTQTAGLVADAPGGRSSTSPVCPSPSVVLTTCAPPLSVQPAAVKLSGETPGAGVYQALSPQARRA